VANSISCGSPGFETNHAEDNGENSTNEFDEAGNSGGISVALAAERNGAELLGRGSRVEAR